MATSQLRQQERKAQQLPPAPHRSGVSGGITPDQLTRARRELGRYLAQWRVSAGLRQDELGKLVCYSRTHIANIEAGRDNTTRVFWHNADTALGASGTLLAMSDQLHALVRGFQAQRERARDQERQKTATPPPPFTSPVTDCPGECGRGPTVIGRWTGREVRALREALRMSVCAFAEHLGMTAATVAGWEHQAIPALPEQSALDQALRLADTDSRTRFRLLLDNPDAPIPGANDSPSTADTPAPTTISRAYRS
ncbi:helix-turn-helix domain-containing protein [Micromonospora sp. NPDC051925]|uniref:helix-turn-helix domain-containing protein n=1 Tax=Micromonospora sp. NPDC051925 TaxID=3364288 RepID=UPI0037C7355C